MELVRWVKDQKQVGPKEAVQEETGKKQMVLASREKEKELANPKGQVEMLVKDNEKDND